MKTRLVSRPALAWTLALVEIAVLAQSVVFFGWSGVWTSPEIAIPGIMAFAAVGALIASRRTHNRLGWLLLLIPVPVTLNVLFIEYGDAYLLHQVPLPFAGVALWIANWGWTPFVGGFPVLLARFPEGRVLRRFAFVDWFAVAGTILLALGLAVSSGSVGARVFATGPLQTLSGASMAIGLALVAVATVGAAASLMQRYRRGDRKLRSQLKWILLAAIATALTSVYMAVVEVAFRIPFGDAMLPSTVALIFIPLAIGVAVLHYQLFDIDVIISRTLVYVVLTAVLGGLYIGVVELVQRLFVIYTGETSDMAIVITAFIVAGAFTPVQKWIDKVIERRFGPRDAAARVHEISAGMQSVVRIIDPHRVAHWLVDQLVEAFGAEGGALYLHAHDRVRPFHSAGRLAGKSAIEVAVRHDQRDLGRLVLGRRRGGVEYSRQEVEALRAAAESLAEALVLASQLGHLVVPASAAQGSRP